MLKVVGLLFVITIIFEGQSVSAAKKKQIPVVFHTKLTNYKIEPNNNFIKEGENGLIQWTNDVQEGANGIMIYDVANGKEYELEDLCKKQAQTSFPTAIKRFLGVDACPIKKETLSLITTDYSRPASRPKGDCEDDLDLTLKLKSKKDKKDIMTLNVKIETLSLNSCN